MKLSYSRYFPTPSFLSMNSFAVDISDRSIKYGEIKATPSGLHLGRYGQIKIPNGIVVSGRIEDEGKLVSILNELRIKEKLHFIRVSLPEEQMYLFTISIPKTENGNIREMILLQIEEHVPLKASDTIFDYNLVSSDGKFLIVEVSAIANTTVESYLSVFNKASLVPLSFELEAQAIARSVVSYDDNDPVMIVDFGNTRTGVSVVCDGRIFMTTTLDIGGVNLTNMISKNFSLSFEEAEEMKRSYGLGGSSNIADIFPVILNGISVLRDELNKQSLYWNTHFETLSQKKEVKRIILCGGDANLSGLASYLEASTGMKVENANAWVNISDMKFSIPAMSFEESLGYTTVLGLALADFFYVRPIINVLPEDVKRRIKNNYWKRFTIMILNILSISIVLATLLLFPSYFFSKEKENLAEVRLETFNINNPELSKNNTEEVIMGINSKLDILAKQSKTNISSGVIAGLLSSRPQGVSFNQIIFNKRTDGVFVMEVYGLASDRNTLKSLKTNLENNPLFDQIDLPISNFIESKNINFKISMIVK